MKNIEIASVKLKDNGTKGIEVMYRGTSTKQNVAFIREDKSKIKAPIHKELEDCFAWLKEHLLEICSYNKKDFDTLRPYTDVTGITYGEKGIIISGVLWVLDRTKAISLNTPLITSQEDYHNFEAVCSICDGIYEETKEYMSGDKTMSDEQLILKFHKNDEEFDPESINHMSKEEKKALATKVLEDMGSIVIHNDEFTDEEEPETEEKKPMFTTPAATTKVVEEPPTVEEPEETDLTELAEPVKKATKAKKETKIKIAEEEDDFSLAPVLAKKS